MGSAFDVIIVGGGAAGIGAARRLAAQGSSALLLEASARLGGRAWTQDIGGYPLDLGCEWLHSGDRNAWVGIAEASGFPVDRGEPPWAKAHPGIEHDEHAQEAAQRAYGDWEDRLRIVAAGSDRASDALQPGGPWIAYVRAIAGFMSGMAPEQISATDYLAYDDASTGRNWHLPSGYGTLVAASLPSTTTLRLATPADRIDLTADGVAVTTRAGTIRAGAAILTISTAVLAGDAIRLPAGTEPWREAAAALPLGRNEKIFLEIGHNAAFEPDSHAYGNLHGPRSAAYSIRPNGWPVIEAFLGGDGARIVAEGGPAAGFAHVSAELAALFGSDVASAIRPLAATSWSRMASIGGAYSCALPGRSDARARLARPFEDRLFFAGEATHPFDFTTAHGAHDSGIRAADEALAALGDRRGEAA
ncbi:FAD-dependent oxidoreductase [Methylobacterium sp. WL30]|uniref:flavin monoamine oxidase family protein n=1 Tax=unclassified Methylobacterium TaxID=2615210 RepID=UPI0011CAD65F|nr:MULTISPECIES: FAD-dependent oxidoreductase [unclassified Methylobacterium]MCJ2076696.1 FAD-dependent oxidoreductase [Methylobacterium sp. E-016]TXM95463.1 FAD-dependent oxidoreductase [Methylobacterium sp. WL116]TXN41867.1 FAD-dependent oxidoreductase [Methylobacterium sp. WL93]TXN51921.1 FAD-dependent oxidoreductase [Methylobacterium sp. WL119]TXN68915.1 FAD-dependent oxidoreductase [Methylobacterium sp. WL30]